MTTIFHLRAIASHETATRHRNYLVLAVKPAGPVWVTYVDETKAMSVSDPPTDVAPQH
jgi:hypothetical protein